MFPCSDSACARETRHGDHKPPQDLGALPAHCIAQPQSQIIHTDEAISPIEIPLQEIKQNKKCSHGFLKLPTRPFCGSYAGQNH